MKTNCFLSIICCLFLLVDPKVGHAQSCTNWLNIPSKGAFFRIGDLDITGSKLTIEATFNRTAPWSGDDHFQGDLVSKHKGPDDCNYLLRPGSAEITTSNGYFKTPEICPIELNKTYHAAMVYDGSTLKFYRNGFLMSQTNASGDLIQNDWQTQIGYYFDNILNTNFVGYINEVRIWNIARSQAEIKATMNTSLTSPQTLSGLLAYYTFDNSLNKQGNINWNGQTFGSAAINTTSPQCQLVADSCGKIIVPPVQVTPFFTTPDTICVNSLVNIQNMSTGASNYYWNFCVADINKVPIGSNLGNTGNTFHVPVFIDYGYDHGNYYGFMVNNSPGGLVRLDFGNSLLNTPIATDLGNFGGKISNSSQGIQLVNNNGRWLAIIVGGDPPAGTSSRILKVDFGNDLTNTPVVTNWGNIGNLNYPHDIYVFQSENLWYGFTVNYRDGTITKFNFGTDFSSAPTGVNIGNYGNLNQPSGICSVNDNGIWRVFVANYGNNTISRIDFGNSLLNPPTYGINLGNIGIQLFIPRDLYIFKYCSETVGFLINENTGGLVRFNFKDLNSMPTASTLGSLGTLSNSHSISRLFREGSSLYAFVPNSYSNSMSRILFSGDCSSVGLPSTNLQNPPDITYNSPGIYNINLSVDEGLPSQSSYCKQIVVIDNLAHLPAKNISFCFGDSIKIGTSIKNAFYNWNIGVQKDSIIVYDDGNFWIESNRYGCVNRDSFIVQVKSNPIIKSRADTILCKGDSTILSTQSAGVYNFLWARSSGLSQTNIDQPTASPERNTQYVLLATDNFGCKTSDTINITVKDPPIVRLGKDTTICQGDSLVLKPNNPGSDIYWQNGFQSPSFIAIDSGYYYAKVFQNGCFASDTIHLAFNPSPVFSVRPDTSACVGSKIDLTTITNEPYTYNWSPVEGLSYSNSHSPIATISKTIQYFVQATNRYNCIAKDSITIRSLPVPSLNLGEDTLVCLGAPVILDAGNSGASYIWSNGLTTKTVQISQPGNYTVIVTNKDGCIAKDSINIGIKAPGLFQLTPSNTEVCRNDTLTLKAFGGDTYEWFTSGNNLENKDSSLTIIPTTNEVYFVKVTDRICHNADTLKSYVYIKPNPTIQINKSNDVSCATPFAQLTASGGVNYKWSPAIAINNPLISTPSVHPQSDLWYKVEVQGSNGCKTVDSIQVLAHFDGLGNFYIPNGFTPNNDGKNDCFGVKYWGTVNSFEISIYNRWGKRVFHSNNLQDCWDGYYKGVLLPNDVFVYYIKVDGPCGRENKKGTVALIR